MAWSWFISEVVSLRDPGMISKSGVVRWARYSSKIFRGPGKAAIIGRPAKVSVSVRFGLWILGRK